MRRPVIHGRAAYRCIDRQCRRSGAGAPFASKHALNIDGLGERLVAPVGRGRPGADVSDLWLTVSSSPTSSMGTKSYQSGERDQATKEPPLDRLITPSASRRSASAPPGARRTLGTFGVGRRRSADGIRDIGPGTARRSAPSFSSTGTATLDPREVGVHRGWRRPPARRRSPARAW
jgi:hypothetical protein